MNWKSHELVVVTFIYLPGHFMFVDFIDFILIQ